jgi:hypothetical protein
MSLTASAAVTSADALLEREWYLDTSLFQDFLDRPAPVAFREAEPHDGSTIARIAPGSGPVIISPVKVRGMRLQVQMTRNLHCLHMIAVATQVRFLYSELVKAEAVRRLRRSHPKASLEDLEDWWGLFSFFLKNYREVPLSLGAGVLTALASSFPLGKNVQDYMHLIVAKEANALFVTSDNLNGQLDALRERFYPGIIPWPVLKQALSNHPKLSHLLRKE